MCYEVVRSYAVVAIVLKTAPHISGKCEQVRVSWARSVAILFPPGEAVFFSKKAYVNVRVRQLNKFT